MRRGAHPYAWSATAALLLAQALRIPPLIDGVTGEPATGFRLDTPLAHILTTPFSALADWLTGNSARQDAVLAVYALSAYWVWRVWLWRPRVRVFYHKQSPLRRALEELGYYGLYLAAAALFLAWGALAPRPAQRLQALDPDDLIVDFHSHTALSWDGRRSFSPEANRAWHRALGFDAAFITDHNRVDGSAAAHAHSLSANDGYSSLEGEELSLKDTHVGVLGNRRPVDVSRYDKDLIGVLRFLDDNAKAGGAATLNLPEFWRNHPRADWDKFAAKSAVGFELYNAVPKALDFPPQARRELIELCRKAGCFLTAVGDSHGWGRAIGAWSVMRLPGHATDDADKLQRRIVSTLRALRFNAVRIVARNRPAPAQGAWVAFDPLAGLWSLLRTLGAAQASACLAWVWLLALALQYRP